MREWIKEHPWRLEVVPFLLLVWAVVLPLVYSDYGFTAHGFLRDQIFDMEKPHQRCLIYFLMVWLIWPMVVGIVVTKPQVDSSRGEKAVQFPGARKHRSNRLLRLSHKLPFHTVVSLCMACSSRIRDGRDNHRTEATLCDAQPAAPRDGGGRAYQTWRQILL